MHKLSDHITTRDIECHGERCCGHSYPIDYRLINALESLFVRVEKRVEMSNGILLITSGFRCRAFNKAIGSKDNSQHTIGRAVDLRSLHLTPLQIRDEALQITAFALGGIGVYETYIHLDVRTKQPMRW